MVWDPELDCFGFAHSEHTTQLGQLVALGHGATLDHRDDLYSSSYLICTLVL